MTKAVSEMSGPELVAEYNRLSNGAKPVKRFASRKVAMKKIAELKKQPSTKKEAKKKEDKRSKIGIEFNVRAGTNREKLLETLHSNFKKPVTKRDILKSVYGSASDENKGAVQMVMKGLYFMIDKGKLPYKIVRDRNEQKETTFGLYPK
jgi:hypothetical protein